MPFDVSVQDVLLLPYPANRTPPPKKKKELLTNSLD